MIGGDSAGNSAELFTPWRGQFAATGALPESHIGAAVSPVGDAGALVLAGGKNRGMDVNSARSYRFATLKTDYNPTGLRIGNAERST